MINGVEATTSAATDTSAAAAMKKSTGLNKDDFLKLFVKQLQNQDPLNPQDSSEFVAQLAQLTQVEQAYNTNTNLQNLMNSINSSSALNASSMIGRTVTAPGNQVSLAGTPVQLHYQLPVASTGTTATIQDANGAIVRTLQLGMQNPGIGQAVWDGKADNGAAMPAGVYTFAVQGKAADGGAVTGTTFTSGPVSGIAFDGSTPLLKIGDIVIPFTQVAGIS